MINQRTDNRWTQKLALDFLYDKIQMEGDKIDCLYEALGVLLESGIIWTLGSYEKKTTAKAIEAGLINRFGCIDWMAIDAVRSQM